jgi:hypothetical protein
MEGLSGTEGRVSVKVMYVPIYTLLLQPCAITWTSRAQIWAVLNRESPWNDRKIVLEVPEFRKGTRRMLWLPMTACTERLCKVTRRLVFNKRRDCIREVPASNLGLETGYMTEVFVVFVSPSRRMPEQYLKIRPRSLPSKSFPFHASPLHRRYIVLISENASLNKLEINLTNSLDKILRLL